MSLSVEQVKQLTKVDFGFMGRGAQRQRVVPGQRIFVRAHGSTEPPSNYWFMEVQGVYEDGADHYFYGPWFYNHEEARKIRDMLPRYKGLLEFMGTEELIFSNHFDVAHSSTVEDIAHIGKLEDGGEQGAKFGPGSWYYRWALKFGSRGGCSLQGVVKGCVCNLPYSPEKDLQHWCGACNKWLHRHCLDEADAQEEEEDAVAGGEEINELVEKLKEMRLVRGRGGMAQDEAPAWAITGPGPLVADFAAEYQTVGSVDDEGEVDLIREILGEEHPRLICPFCRSVV